MERRIKEWRKQCETAFHMTEKRIVEIETGTNLPDAVKKIINRNKIICEQK